MFEEVDDDNFFQQDFTTASEWEIFTSRIEEIIHEWKLPYLEECEPLKENQLSFCDWETTIENISFDDFELSVTRYKAKLENKKNEIDDESEIPSCQAFMDLMSQANNFCIKNDENDNIHPIARWYGLRDFVVISPVKKPITNESQIKLILSSINIAISESSCEVPIFLQCLPHKQNLFSGVCECQSIRLNFDMVHLQKVPPTCKYLSELITMFKGKIGVQYVNPIAVAVRSSFGLTKFLNFKYCTIKNFTTLSDEELEASNRFDILPFGSLVDPVQEILLNCTWPHVLESLVMDSPVHSDLDPLLAPNLSIRIKFHDLPLVYLSDCLTEYLNLMDFGQTLIDILGDSFIYGTTLTLEKNPLDVLTETKIPSLTSVLPTLSNRSSKKSKRPDGPLSYEQMNSILYYLLPDLQNNTEHCYKLDTSEETLQILDSIKIKSAQPDSLVHRLACVLSLCNTKFGGVKSVAQLWATFAQEIRIRVDNCTQIPGVAKGFPDSRTCLLHQKFQMLNICMERRRIREGGLPFSMTEHKRNSSWEDEEDDDEFFDCSEDDETTDNVKHAPWNKPEGRFSRLANMTLIDSDEPLYIPITQEPVTKTEDQLEDDTEVMLKLGPGSELRAQMMSASLFSDMESFKAANPNGKLEDFIRWYSPRDWIEDDEDDENNENIENVSTRKVKGHLSSRMLIPGNTWQTVWAQARPVPARRQKRLFDDGKEAEKVLHFLESLSIGKICELTLASLAHSAILRLQEEIMANNFDLEIFIENIDLIVSNCSKLSRSNWVLDHPSIKVKKWENLINEIANVEYMIEKTKSIVFKLFNSKILNDKDKKILNSLLKNYEVQLENGWKNEISKQIYQMFINLKNANEKCAEGSEDNVNAIFQNPTEKQFILRVQGETINKGLGSPQFLRAIINQNQFRLCGAFSKNTTFY